MRAPLRVLIVEDSADDAQLVIRALHSGGFDVTAERVETRDGMAAALDRGPWDLVISDFRLSRISAVEAAALHRERGLDAPFILVSGTVGEKQAAEAMKAGAHEFFLKSELTLLPSAVERELREAANRTRRRQAESERKLAEQALRASESRYRELVEHMADGMLVADREEKIVLVNSALRAMLGYSTAEMLGQTVETLLVREQDRDAMAERMRRRLEGEAERYEIELRKRSGELIWTRFSAAPLRDEAGRISGSMAIVTDITERKLAERALRESEERYRRLFEASPLPMWVFDLETLRFLAVNEAATRRYGWSEDEFLSMSIDEIRPPEDLGRLERNLAAIESGAPNVDQWRHLTKTGEILEVEISASSVSYEGRPARLVLVNDITDRKRAERMLAQSQRIEAIGRLAGGVAHDFHNIVGVIQGYGELAMEGLEPEHPVREQVEEMVKAAKRAAALTRQLQAFSRKQVLQPRRLDLNALVAEARKMLDRVLGEDVRLVFVPAAGLGTVRADPGQIEQILVNLAVNARDAMPRGGTLTIETANLFLDDQQAALRAPATAGRYVRLTVTDTGTGMDAATASRVFEPFFTTKPEGQGTGLGLATVYGIVKQSEGFIWVWSEPNQGARFEILFPRIDESPETVTPAAPLAVAPGGSETILLVEDNQALREVTRQRLAGVGYRVLIAEDGARALALAASHPEPIDLLLTDVVMPKLGGGALARELSRTRPGLRVLFMSGYADGALSHHGLLVEGVTLLEKPFSGEKLLRAVREQLDRPPAA